MQIKLNDRVTNIPSPCQLAQLLRQFSLPTKGSALAINGRIIPTSTWSEVQLQENDDVVVFQVIAGG